MCDICGRYPCDPRCPNYETPPSDFTGMRCDMCGEEILVGEEYLDDGNGRIAHSSCVTGIMDLVNWLELSVKEIIDDYNVLSKTAEKYDYMGDY